MLKQLDLDRSIGKREYNQLLPTLQAQLFDLEQLLIERRLPVLVVVEGWAGTSKVGLIGSLTSRLDPRGLRVHSIAPPRGFERQYPWLHRFWLRTPRYGEIAIFDRSWYRGPLGEYAHGDITQADWRARCEDIVAFERQLADDGAIILKFLLHISREEQRKRFKESLADKLLALHVTDEDRWQQRNYKQVRLALEDMIARTDSHHARWIVVPSEDKRYSRIAVFKTILAVLGAQLGHSSVTQPGDDNFDYDSASSSRRRTPKRQPVAAQVSEASPTPGILRQADLTLSLPEKAYNKELKELQTRLYLLGLQVYQQQRPVVLVFEGWDAAGKGGTIQRITAKLDPRSYVVHAIAAPSGDDREHHYLYRFWRRLPPSGTIGIFDRSWYGRVLVERVEGFARPDEWQRAYGEINEFERQLVDFGTIICKFWMHISPDEQMRRFEERQNVPHKAWKLTDEDWRNREKWGAYEVAADEMLLRTSTPLAPWTVVEGEDKRFARIRTLRTLVARLESELGPVEL